MVSSQHIQESLALVIGIYLNSPMLLEYYLIMPILKLKSGRVSDLLFITDASVSLALNLILGWKRN